MYRIRAGHASARYSLTQVGPRALPRIYGELERIGRKAVGPYRTDLVHVICDIRQKRVARLIRSPLEYHARVALLEPDQPMIAALQAAVVNEPSVEQRENSYLSLATLDFNTQIELCCSTMPKLAHESQGEMLSSVLGPSIARLAQGYDPAPRYSDVYYWGQSSAAEIARTKAQMQQKLTCATPLIIDLLAQSAPKWRSQIPLWGNTAVDSLSQLSPLPDAAIARLTARLSQVQNDGFAARLLGIVVREHARAQHKSAQAVLEESYTATDSERVRAAARKLNSSDQRGLELNRQTFFCHTFARTPDDERDDHLLSALEVTPSGLAIIGQRVATEACVTTTLEQAIETALLTGSAPALKARTAPGQWFGLACSKLDELKEQDAGIASWARSLRQRVPGRDGDRLDSLLE